MGRKLVRHPDFGCDAVQAIEVEAARPAADRLALRYRLSGVTDALVLPPPATGRADGLWKRTCLEAFVRTASGAGYRELNAANGQWAAYRFSGYREGMDEAEIGPPDLRLERQASEVLLTAVWRVDLPPGLAWRIGVSAVIEDRDRGLSYWALAHPPGKPDFHHPDCFALELPAPDRP